MTLEELDHDLNRRKKLSPPPVECGPISHLILVDMGNGCCEYRILTEDGRLVPAEEGW